MTFTNFTVGPVVEIKVNCNITVASWYKGTPIPMICFVKPSMIHQAKAQVSYLNNYLSKRVLFEYCDCGRPNS